MKGSLFAVELGYNVRRGTEYFVSLLVSVVMEQYNAKVNGEELFGITGYLTL
jgi:hypothetical protein